MGCSPIVYIMTVCLCYFIVKMKMCYIMRYLFDNWRYFLSQTIVCMGAVSALVTIVVAVKSDLIKDNYWILFLCFGVSLLWGFVCCYPKNKIAISFVHKRSVVVKKGNIWDVKKGIVVVPVNNFFDTQVDDIVIGKNTLHGQFVDLYKKRYPTKDLYQEIKRALQADSIVASGSYPNRKHVTRNSEDYSEAYPMGTVVRLKEGDLQYYLVVVTEFDEENHVINQPEMYSMILLKLIKQIDKWNSGVPVFLPIIGSGQMGLPMTKQEIVAEMLSCFNMAEHYVAIGGTTILVYENDMKDISLNKIKYQFSKI